VPALVTVARPDHYRAARRVLVLDLLVPPLHRREGGDVSIDDDIDEAAREARKAHAKLGSLIAGQCPGPHQFRQHRDGRSPWCPTCRYTADGVRIALPPPTARFDLPGGESTSAAMRRVILELDATAVAREEATAALHRVEQEHDEALAKRDQAIENSDSWRRELHRTEAELASARAELAAARRRITELEADHG
jgi:hypothetical protein